MENALEEINSRLGDNTEVTWKTIINKNNRKKKRIYKNEESLRALGKKIKCTNIFIIMCAQKEREKGTGMVEISLTCKGNIHPSPGSTESQTR